MKVRTGFVSNSSSSSFIVVGFETNTKHIRETFLKEFLKKNNKTEVDFDGDDPWEFREFLQEKFPDIIFMNDWECEFSNRKGNKEIVGEVLADINSEDCDSFDGELSIEEIIDKALKVKNKLQIEGEIKPKIYIGTRSC